MKQLPMNRIRYIHFIGIGGAGMCGIAEILHGEGYVISGSDLHESAVTRRLHHLGITVYVGHQASQVDRADVVVVSSAIAKDNVELLFARQQKIPVIQRAAMLAELMRFRFGIAIAGTHGKTTTTSLAASIFQAGGLDPTYLIGGKLLSSNSNAHLGKSDYLIAEADESDASFLHLHPIFTVVTNVDADHLENYGNSIENIEKSFIDYIHHLPFYGLAVVCSDDPGVRKILPTIQRQVITYGFDSEADVRIEACQQTYMQSDFTLTFKNRSPLTITLSLPGKHNVLNAAAAIIIAVELCVADKAILTALENFQGVGRRFEYHGKLTTPSGSVIDYIDDYAHHPAELTVLLQAAREAYPGQRMVLVFQPHRFTRTQEQFDQFCEVLSQADELVLLPVYPAGEQPIAGADSYALAKHIRKQGVRDPIVIPSFEQFHARLPGLLQQGDVLITAGAGSIGQIAHQLGEQCRD